MAKLVAKRYATALFEVSKENNNVDKYQSQLQLLADIFKDEPQLRTILQHPKVTQDEKKDILSSILSKVVDQEVINFLYILIDKSRERYIEDIIHQYNELANNYNNIEKTLVVSAVSLTLEEVQVLTEKLSKAFNKNIVIENKIDPEVIGGMLVKIGDRVIDGTIKGKLTALRGQLNTITLQEIGVS